ncbi:hypothetical protein V1281_006584 [Nitrobacteraceae bacterium AZCC 2161]|jgi:hypothetical protein
MTKMKIIAVAAVLSSAMATPLLAQDMTQRPAKAQHQRHHVNVNDRNAYNANAAYNRSDSGFWPADTAAGIVGGAIGTAGAIASAPFQGDAYANSGGYYGDNYYGAGYNGGRFSPGYASRNNFSCQPGSFFRGEDGRRHICQ